MGKKWDYDVPSVEVWAECLRVLKPGGHLLAFAGTRTQHRMAVRIEDAGFEIRDMIAWVYGSGFPKSLDVSKAIDKAAGAEREVVGDNPNNRPNCAGKQTRSMAAPITMQPITAPATPAAQQWQGWGTALKPALEPITVARKPLGEKTVAANVLAHGTGAINVDGCRVGANGGTAKGSKPQGNGNGIYGAGLHGACEITQLNAGRWPANLIHDGSDEVVAGFPATAVSKSGGKAGAIGYHSGGAGADRGGHDDNGGSAARFFYCAKASKKDRDEGLEGFDLKTNDFHRASSGLNQDRPGREGRKQSEGARNHHPTVKPTALMRYLCRLITPPQGIVLDPFMGSGSTGKAAVLEGFQFIGIERDAEYLEIAKARIARKTSQQNLL